MHILVVVFQGSVYQEHGVYRTYNQGEHRSASVTGFCIAGPEISSRVSGYTRVEMRNSWELGNCDEIVSRLASHGFAMVRSEILEEDIEELCDDGC